MEADTQYTHVNAYEFIEKLTDNEDLKACCGGYPARSMQVFPSHLPCLHMPLSTTTISRVPTNSAEDLTCWPTALEKVIIDHDGEVLRNK